jgi:hypothetical protein
LIITVIKIMEALGAEKTNKLKLEIAGDIIIIK